MKIPDVYRDWRIMFGLALMLLGAGNWVVGWRNTQLYGQLIANERRSPADSSSSRGFDEIEAGSSDVLKPFNSPARKISYARARMDFYHATFLTGQVLAVSGLLVMLLGFLSVIRRDARRPPRRLPVRSHLYPR
jgi:hypothetical protein